MKKNTKIKIQLGSNSYDIILGEKLLESSGEYISKVIPKGGKIFVVTDSNVAKLYLKPLEISLKKAGFQVHSTIIPAGEKSKNFAQLEKIVNEIFKDRPERKSTLIALGGGVVGDITGFAASVILRGVNFIQIPTTLLAMVDSSVGGKTGINLAHGKNLVGSFYQPKLVLADTSLLKTLPKREFLAGFAEVVKYGVISDKKFFEFLEKEKDFSKITKMVETSCRAKAKIVAADEKENDVRALLNLGHTFGHALEGIFGYDGKLLHGEGVAIGMVLALQLSEYLNICPKGRAARLEKLLAKKGLRTKISQLGKKIKAEDMIKFMKQDKKVSANKLVFILASDIGKSFIKKDVNEAILKKILNRGYMKKIILVFSVILNLVFASAQAEDAKPTPQQQISLNANQIALLNDAQDYLAKVKTVKANFVQINPGTSIVSSGKIFISKPGQLKMSYSEPYRIDYYINDDDLTQYDHDLDEVTRADAPENPLKVLLYDGITLAKNDLLTVTNVTDEGDSFTVFLLNKAATIRELSGLILKFKKMPIELFSIGRVDYEGNNTQTNFSSVVINEDIETTEFRFKRPKQAFPSR